MKENFSRSAKQPVVFVTLSLVIYSLGGGSAQASTQQPISKLRFSLETSLNPPLGLDAVNDPETINWMNLAAPVDGFLLSLSGQFEDYNSEIGLTIGYKWASGVFPDGSMVDRKPATNYFASQLPIRFHVNMIPLAWDIRPFAGLWFGMQMSSIRYDITEDPFERSSGGALKVGLGLRGGVDIPIVDGFGARLFFDAHAIQQAKVEFSPGLSMGGVSGGISIYYEMPIKKTALARSELTGERLPEVYKRLLRQEKASKEMIEGKPQEAHQKRLEAAFSEIREADQLRHMDRCEDAVKHYRRGVKLLPPTPEAQKNVEVPVRLDWAGCLVQMGMNDEAIRILKSALEIDKNSLQILNALEALGADDEEAALSVEPIVPLEPVSR